MITKKPKKYEKVCHKWKNYQKLSKYFERRRTSTEYLIDIDGIY